MQPNERKKWMSFVPEAALQTYRKAGFLSEIKFGERSALVVVDLTYGFTGSEGLSLEQATEEFPTASGPSSWQAMPKVRKLIDMFRERGLPIVFTHSDNEVTRFAGTATTAKRTERPRKFNEFPALIAPQDGEFVIGKPKASAFFQTSITPFLIKQRIDTLVICGTATSGCVRATVVDAHSHGFATFVVDDCCSDRWDFAHAANLFDMHAKYASVLSLDELERVMGPATAQAASRPAPATGTPTLAAVDVG
jgi:maleamate amidohydrolase